MTHASIPAEDRAKVGISDSLVSPLLYSNVMALSVPGLLVRLCCSADPSLCGAGGHTGHTRRSAASPGGELSGRVCS